MTNYLTFRLSLNENFLVNRTNFVLLRNGQNIYFHFPNIKMKLNSFSSNPISDLLQCKGKYLVGKMAVDMCRTEGNLESFYL